MLQLHLSYQQSYCLLRCDLYYRFYGRLIRWLLIPWWLALKLHTHPPRCLSVTIVWLILWVSDFQVSYDKIQFYHQLKETICPDTLYPLLNLFIRPLNPRLQQKHSVLLFLWNPFPRHYYNAISYHLEKRWNSWRGLLLQYDLCNPVPHPPLAAIPTDWLGLLNAMYDTAGNRAGKNWRRGNWTWFKSNV